MPASVFPMLATKIGAPFSRPGWLFEPKWDGYRAVCFLRDGAVRFTSRNQRNLTKRFPELQIIGKSIKASKAILDGEIVALDKNGSQCFEQLQNHKRDCVIIYFAFDLLFRDGMSLTDVPLIQRKAHLKRILPKSMAGRIRFTDHVIDKGLDLFAALEAQQLEGMVGKRADSLYVPGRSKEWLKVKTRAGMAQMQKRIESWGHR
jgi:bifunctional non-homologous end joining protein LigD